MVLEHEGLRLMPLSGPEIALHLEALARVRMRVFRDWPYLYAGSLEYERQYLQTYLRCPGSLAVLVWDGGRCVGATTAIPLADESTEVRAPFEGVGLDVERIDYFGESVLLPEYRGLGLGVKFFELREAHARAQGLNLCAFCAVERDDRDPARPVDYVPNDAFWRRRGYQPRPDLRTSFAWPDLGQEQSTEKPVSFWLKNLDA